jgi:hypothetical protein
MDAIYSSEKLAPNHQTTRSHQAKTTDYIQVCLEVSSMNSYRHKKRNICRPDYGLLVYDSSSLICGCQHFEEHITSIFRVEYVERGLGFCRQAARKVVQLLYFTLKMEAVYSSENLVSSYTVQKTTI